MKTLLFSAVALGLSSSMILAQKFTTRGPSPAPPPPLIYTAPFSEGIRPAPAPDQAPYVYEQRAVAGRPFLVTPEQADAIISRFREAYEELDRPRLLIYVNRELVDERSGIRLAGRREEVESTRTLQNGTEQGATADRPSSYVENIRARNTFRVSPRPEPSLADRQTIRDVERLFGRPLRMGGAQLADQRIATQLLSDRPLSEFAATSGGEQARRDRQALAQIADVAVEILISSREITATEISGERVYSVPDIQATAIRLSDSAIIGQASASDLIGSDRNAGRIARTFDVREITEATALALMEDMSLR
jgi:hypothetical protein